MLNCQRYSPLTFGIIADVQYGNADDGFNYRKTRKRYYRNSLSLLRNAVNYWRDCTPKVDFILQLGDHIDGLNRHGNSDSALATAMAPFASLHKPVYHLLGNHDFYNFTRKQIVNTALFSALKPNCSAPKDKAYYTILPCPSLRFVALDCYEVSLLGYPVDSKMYEEACSLLEKNPNEDKNSPEGLEGSDRRFVKFNGGLCREQLEWLDGVLYEADKKKQNVLVIGHTPVCHKASDYVNLCWNCDEIMDVMHKHACVSAYLAGHDHDGGSAIDSHGIHHLVFPGVIETAPGDNAFATATLYCDRLEVVGHGRVPSYSIRLKFPTLIL